MPCAPFKTLLTQIKVLTDPTFVAVPAYRANVAMITGDIPVDILHIFDEYAHQIGTGDT